MTTTNLSPYDEQTARAAKHRWRPADAATCPRVAAALRCWAGTDRLCVCQRHHHALDHARTWQDPDDGLVLTGEPYDIDGDELVALVAECSALGLDVSISGRSMWLPGATILLTIRKRDTDPYALERR
jgi:hypothetical protein